MSANRRRKLLLEQTDLDSDKQDLHLLNLKTECQAVLAPFGLFFDISALLHLIVCGCSIGYIMILASTDDFSEWAQFFCYLSQPADYFFYVLTFILFISTSVMTILLIQINFQNLMAKVVLAGSAGLQAIALLVTTYCIPMSIMIRRSVNEFGDWYHSPLAEDSAKKVLYNGYRGAIIFRLVCIAITGPLVAFVMSMIRSVTFQAIFAKM
jgi:hypothetical protein